MSNIRILTDATAQFTKPVFPGRQFVEVLPLATELLNSGGTPSGEIKVQNLPPSVMDPLEPRLIIPTADEFRQIFLNMAQNSNAVVAILHSANLSPMFENARQAADSLKGRATIQLIDSMSTSVGLGYLVQSAAQTVQHGASILDVERQMRSLLPHIYSVFCIPSLTYLHHAGFLGKAQSMVGEMLNVMPIFTLEEGVLTPLEKVRNQRHLLDFLQEFLDEFSDLDQISIIQSIPGLVHEVKTLREHATLNFPNTPFSEHTINLPLATWFGPRSIAVFAIENPNA